MRAPSTLLEIDFSDSSLAAVPIIWDKKTETIVNNESSEIIRFFNTSFNSLLPEKFASIDLYPESARAEIDSQADWVYNTVNNGVYKSGFATTQEAYESNVVPLFESLDKLEKILDGGKEFIAGDQLTEADVRLFTTLVRASLRTYHCRPLADNRLSNSQIRFDPGSLPPSSLSSSLVPY